MLLKSTKKYFSSKEIIDGCYLKDDDIYYYDEKIINVHDLKLQGAHNYENVMCAIMVSKELFAVIHLVKVDMTPLKRRRKNEKGI